MGYVLRLDTMLMHCRICYISMDLHSGMRRNIRLFFKALCCNAHICLHESCHDREPLCGTGQTLQCASVAATLWLESTLHAFK